MKVFLYCDSDSEPSTDNVFLSGAYRDVGQFRRLNPGMRPLKSYDADEYLDLIQGQIKSLKEKAKDKVK